MLLVASFLCVAGLPAHAINKCISPDGKVTFTDAACAPDDKAKKMDIVVPPPSDIEQARAINAKVDEALRTLEEGPAVHRNEGDAPPVPPLAPTAQPGVSAPSPANDDDYRRRDPNVKAR
jgi:hypothetical protein